MWTKPQKETVHALGITFASSSFICACITIFLIVRQQRYKGLLQRFPIYVCGLEIAFNIFHSFDHSYGLVHGVLPPDGICRAIGAAIEFFVGGQILLNCMIALTIYLAVCHKRQFEWGRYDWKLLLFVFGTPVVMVVFGLGFDLFGDDELWCYVRRGTSFSRYAFLIYGVGPITFGMLFTSFCYLSAIKRILYIPPEIKDSSLSQRMMATRKTSTFILVFTVQWIFPWFYVVTALADFDTFVVRMLVTLMNAGGVFNLGALLYNYSQEGTLRKELQLSQTATSARTESGHVDIEKDTTSSVEIE